jgi:hypothetical protein
MMGASAAEWIFYYDDGDGDDGHAPGPKAVNVRASATILPDFALSDDVIEIYVHGPRREHEVDLIPMQLADCTILDVTSLHKAINVTRKSATTFAVTLNDGHAITDDSTEIVVTTSSANRPTVVVLVLFRMD